MFPFVRRFKSLTQIILWKDKIKYVEIRGSLKAAFFRTFLRSWDIAYCKTGLINYEPYSTSKKPHVNHCPSPVCLYLKIRVRIGIWKPSRARVFLVFEGSIKGLSYGTQVENTNC